MTAVVPTPPSTEVLAAETTATSTAMEVAITRAITYLLPSVRCEARSGPGAGEPDEPAGAAPTPGGGVVWSRLGEVPWRAEVRRDGAPLTANELQLLAELPAALEATSGVGPDLGGPMPYGIMLEEAVVGRLLHRRSGGRFPHAATGTILGAVRQLSMRRYEGRAATSGVVAVTDPEGWQGAVDADPQLAADPFVAPLRFDHAFFDRPASHRYVDGRHSTWVVGPDLEVLGLIRVNDARHLDGQDIALGAHVDRLLAATGAAWCATVDERSTVDVYAAEGLQLRWRSYHWRLLDRTLLPTLLASAGLGSADARSLAGTLLALSDGALGTLVLIPDGRRTPGVAGMIDSSECGAALLTHLVGRRIDALRAEGTLTGILSCDGLSIISPDGELQMTGAIIELPDGVGGAGGGRTQAAASASRHGLTAMVSTDGQVTLHRDGAVVLHLER